MLIFPIENAQQNIVVVIFHKSRERWGDDISRDHKLTFKKIIGKIDLEIGVVEKREYLWLTYMKICFSCILLVCDFSHYLTLETLLVKSTVM